MGDDFLKSIGDLENYKFVVPSYQRGYRWQRNNVKMLLNDLNDFFTQYDQKDYILQPIVVKEDIENNKYELIDGQQRLTTIFLIEKYCENKNSFHIEYKTRDNSKRFLENINLDNINEAKKDENPDFYYMYSAYKEIDDWFERFYDKNESKKQEFLKKLRDRVKIIWYKVEPEQDGREIFQQINTGKIPLTNAEIIKTFFHYQISKKYINKNEKQLQQINFQKEWDEIMLVLKDDDFWAFFSKEINIPHTERADYFFKLYMDIVEKKKIELSHANRYKLFAEFSDLISDIENKKYENYLGLWNKVKEFFYYWYDWYMDKEIYHLIGFINWRDDVKEIVKKAISQEYAARKEFVNELKKEINEILTRKEFVNQLKVKINKILNRELKPKSEENEKDNKSIKDKIKELSYGDDNDSIKLVLFLYNLIKYYTSPWNLRFPFQSFKNTRWSIEHIFAQNSEKFVVNTENKEYIESFLADVKKLIEKKDIESLKKEDIEVCIKVVESLNDNDNEEKIKEIENLINEIFEKLELHNIKNLALLPSNLNSSLGNKRFDEKRKKIIEQYYKKDSFVPLATFMVFNKLYEGQESDMTLWFLKADGEKYLEDITNSITNFLNNNNNGK